ncbi:MAG: hypothetical protein ACTS4T_00805 [Candidatus Hodgkinia cicadicola]
MSIVNDLQPMNNDNHHHEVSNTSKGKSNKSPFALTFHWLKFFDLR